MNNVTPTGLSANSGVVVLASLRCSSGANFHSDKALLTHLSLQIATDH